MSDLTDVLTAGFSRAATIDPRVADTRRAMLAVHDEAIAYDALWMVRQVEATDTCDECGVILEFDTGDPICDECTALVIALRADRDAVRDAYRKMEETTDTCDDCGVLLTEDEANTTAGTTLCDDCNAQFEQREDERERTRMVAATTELTEAECSDRLGDCSDHGCLSCSSALLGLDVLIVPCHDCGQACRKNSYGDIVCVNVGCNLFLI